MTLLEVIVFIIALISIPFLFIFLNVSSLWVFQSFTTLLEKPSIGAFKQLIIWLIISVIASILLILAMSIVKEFIRPLIAIIYVTIYSH
ncbi:MAG: hypothetical protein QXP36_09940 [Conexivisphaerales archaeon]